MHHKFVGPSSQTWMMGSGQCTGYHTPSKTMLNHLKKNKDVPLRVFFRSRGPQHSRWSRSCVSPGRKIRRKRRLSWAKSSSVIVLSSSFLAVRDENLMGNLNTYIHAFMHACLPANLPTYVPTYIHYITLHYITKRSSTKAVF